MSDSDYEKKILEEARNLELLLQRRSEIVASQKKSQNSDVRKKIHRIAKRLGLVGAVATGVVLFPKSEAFQKISDCFKGGKEQTEVKTPPISKEEEIKIYNDNIKVELEKKYVISDQESFDKLYEAALPLMQVALFSVECCALDPYSDNGGPVKNTRGIGNYYCWDHEKGKMVKTSAWLREHGEVRETVESAFQGIDDWCSCASPGTKSVREQMFHMLKGSELNPRECAAIMLVGYGNGEKRKNLCRFVCKHYNDPISISQYIERQSVPSNFPGIAKRWVHAACLYSNEEYVQQMYQFRTKMVKLKYGGDAYSASVSHMSWKDVSAIKGAIKSGDLESIIKEQKRILNASQGDLTIAGVIQQEVLNESYRDNLLKYCFKENETINLEDAIEMAKTDSKNVEREKGEHSLMAKVMEKTADHFRVDQKARARHAFDPKAVAMANYRRQKM